MYMYMYTFSTVDPKASKSSSTKHSGSLYRPNSKYLKEEKEETTLPTPLPSVTKKPPVNTVHALLTDSHIVHFICLQHLTL